MGKVGAFIMFDVWRTNKFNSNLLEELVATFHNIDYARKFVDLMAEHESEEFIIKSAKQTPLKERERTLEEKFENKLTALHKDFSVKNKEKEFDSFDYER